MNNKILYAVLLLILGQKQASGQWFGTSSELGVFAGPTFFQSDYGERFDLKTNFGNNGFGVGIFNITNFSYNYRDGAANPMTYFNDHFKLRTEVSFNKSEFRHYGTWVDRPTNSVFAQNQLRAMRGATSITNVGMQMEFYPWSIYNADLEISRYNFAPYISIGAQYSFFQSKSYSTIGTVDDPMVTPTKYLGASRSEFDTTWSITGSVGSRYKIGDFEDIVLEVRWQQYFSNWVDGLNPNPTFYPENKSHDWQFWVSVGYIYHIE